MITRQQLEIINRRTLRYPLQTAEKDYFLAVVIKLISESSLGNTLVFSSVRVMNVKEIAAEKIRAMSDRARYRDFYDLFLLLQNYSLDLYEILGYVQKKEIRKTISKTNIQNNFAVINAQKEEETMQIYYSRVVDDKQIMAMIESLPFTEILPR